MEARLQTLYEEAGRPGARAFRTFARRKGENITSTEAQQFVAGQATAQVFQAKLPSDGKVTASREDMRFQADLMDFSKRRKQPAPDWMSRWRHWRAHSSQRSYFNDFDQEL